MATLEAQCGGINPAWGDLKRAVLEWRLYNLHRSAVKAEGRRQAGAGICQRARSRRRWGGERLTDGVFRRSRGRDPQGGPGGQGTVDCDVRSREGSGEGCAVVGFFSWWRCSGGGAGQDGGFRLGIERIATGIDFSDRVNQRVDG